MRWRARLGTHRDKKRAIFVYQKDPFVNYADWLKVDETVKYMRGAGYSTDAMMLIDRHNKRAVMGRLEMLVEPSHRGSFHYLPLYNKRMKFKYGLLGSLLLTCWVSLKLCRSIFFKYGRYDILIMEEADNKILRFLSGIIKTSYKYIAFNEVVLGQYAFGSYGGEHPSKEAELRGIIKGVLKSSLDNI